MLAPKRLARSCSSSSSSSSSLLASRTASQFRLRTTYAGHDDGAGGQQLASHLAGLLPRPCIQSLRSRWPALQLRASSKVLQQGTPDAPELPPYAVVLQQATEQGVFDVRMYQAYAVVEMEYQRREEGYLALGEYMGGANAAKSRFAFTAPVVMRYFPNGRKVMQLMVGSQVKSQQLPEEQRARTEGSSRADPTLLPAPTNSAVRLAVAGAELVAVLKFDGFITPETAEAARQKLVKLVEADGRFKLAAEEAAGMFRVGQYGAVHTLEARLNEMMLAIDVC